MTKVYVGKGKQVKQFDGVNVTLDYDALAPYVYEYNGKKYVNVLVSRLRQPDSYGKTHTAQCDDWKPDASQAKSTTNEVAPETQTQPENGEVDPNDIPF